MSPAIKPSVVPTLTVMGIGVVVSVISAASTPRSIGAIWVGAVGEGLLSWLFPNSVHQGCVWEDFSLPAESLQPPC
eukprot:14010015-Ditylum_brightwellii.AAC.1